MFTSRFTSRRRIGAAIAATIATSALVLAGCSSTSSDDPEEITVYSGRSEELVKPLFDQFTAETGIKVNARYGDSTELAAQIVEEGANTPADVFFAQDAGALGAVAAEGLFADVPAGPAARVDAEYRTDKWLGVTGRVRSIVYDSQKVTNPPTKVSDLVEPKWKGQVAIAPTNASFQAFVTGMRLAWGDERTQEWLDALKANDAQTYEKNGLIVEAVNRGDVEVGLVNHYYWLQVAAEEGGADNMRAQPAYMESGDPGLLVNVAGAALTQRGASKPSAVEFIEFLVSDSAQTYFLEETFEYPLVIGMAGPEGMPSLAEITGPDVDLDDLKDLPTTLEMIQRAGLT